MVESYLTKSGLIYSSDFVSVSFDSEIPCIIWKPLGSIPSEDWKKSFETGVKFIANNFDKFGGTIHWLNDTKLIQAVGIENISWLQDTANNFASSFDKMKIAFVYPKNKLGLIALTLYLRETYQRGYKLPIGLFETENEAKIWLLKK